MAFLFIGSLANGSPCAPKEKAVARAAVQPSSSVSNQFSAKTSWGRQAFEKDIATLSAEFSKLKDLPVEQTVEQLLKIDIRQVFFRLQSLARVYSKIHQQFKPLREHFKEIEDGIGRLALARSLTPIAKQLNKAALVDHFEAKEAGFKAELVQTLQETGWLHRPEKIAAELLKGIEKIEIETSGQKDKEFLVATFLSDAAELNKQVKKLQFTQEDIELGLHELRRKIRWILIQAASLNGMVELKDVKPSPRLLAWLKELEQINPRLFESKYIRYEQAKIDGPIALPRQHMVVMAEIVKQVGDLKDKAEVQIYFDEAFKDLRLSESEQNALRADLALLLKAQPIDHQDLSDQVQRRLNSSGLLTSFGSWTRQLNRQ